MSQCAHGNENTVTAKELYRARGSMFQPLVHSKTTFHIYSYNCIKRNILVVNTHSDMFERIPAYSFVVRALAKMRCFSGV